MASALGDNHPLSPGRIQGEFKLPMPPPLLHTRSGNALYDSPSTPTSNGFTTPYATPQGSPSKSKLPPGAKDLPNVFDNAMVLSPSSPTKAGRQQLSPHSPNKTGRQGMEESLEDSTIHQDYLPATGSPSKKSNKENTPPGGRVGKESNYTTSQAAVSRQEPYQSRDVTDASMRSRYSPTRGLTAEELEKLQLPKVKRLANVIQICELDEFTLTYEPES
jgi:cell cycle protein kinase DBF2